MASDTNPYASIGCSAGKTILVDPNKFGGQSSSSNISVPLEDLSIYVQLETTKRARTVLQEGSLFNTKEFKVNFIEGTQDGTTGNKKYLTTKYTDLTTDFETGSDGESLGITSIDIDFNTAYAPLVVINFVDVRGSSIFQNEEVLNINNKYSTLFQLPYPIFTLTIKGYYGMPVKYDLHMTKFNAKFNSKTGNFEITANFIGYTYAFLSDMIIGYLRAIPHTKYGGKLYEEIRKTRPYLLTLDELISAISNIDQNLKKLKAEDVEVQNFSALSEKLEKYDDFYTIIKTLADVGISHIKNENEYRFIILRNDFTGGNDSLETYLNNYNTAIDNKLTTFNTNDVSIDANSIKSNTFIVYNNISISALTSTNQSVINTLPQKLKDDSDRKAKLISYFRKQGRTDTVTIYDLNDVYEALDKKKNELSKKVEEDEVKIGEKVRVQIKSVLQGLDPTIRNIVEIFTTSVEVFMQTLFTVSQYAVSETGEKQVRNAQLKKLVNNNTSDSLSNLDYTNKAVSKIGANTNSGPQEQLFYPWPEYREKVDKNFVEAYLGKAGVLEIPTDVTELNFIDDLLNAFITSAKIGEAAIIEEQKNATTWYPSNPLDTKIFFPQTYPYKRFQNTKVNDIVNNAVMRALIYLGVSNDKLTPEEIQAYADNESSLILLDADEKLKMALANLTKESFINASAKFNNTENVKFLNYWGGDQYNEPTYFYKYIFPSGNQALLPLNHGDNNTFDFSINESPSDTLNFYLTDTSQNIFLTNYGTTGPYKDKTHDDYKTIVKDVGLITGQTKNEKASDGGIYVKFFTVDDLNQFKQDFYSPKGSNNSYLDYNVMAENNQSDFRQKVLNKEIVFDQFGGQFGIQEYGLQKYSVPNINTAPAPYRLGFFNGGYELEFADRNKLNKLMSKRKKETIFDLAAKSGKVPLFNKDKQPVNFYEKYYKDDVFPRADIGGTMVGLNKLINSDESDTVYPYTLFQNNNDLKFNLFTSRLYYKQNNDKSKAFLFLHTLPFYGLIGRKNADDWSLDKPGGVLGNLFALNTFGHRAGFVSVPRLWAAFVGGLLWRVDRSEPIYDDTNGLQIGGGSGRYDPIRLYSTNADGTRDWYVPDLNADKLVAPTRNQYFTLNPTSFEFLTTGSKSSKLGYMPLEDVLLQLPEQVKNEFKSVFFQFVENEEGNSPWQTFKPMVELVGTDNQGTEWENRWNYVSSSITEQDGLKYMSVNELKQQYFTTYGDNKKVIDNYTLINRYDNGAYKYSYFAEFKDDSDAVHALNYMFKEEIIMLNASYRIWSDKLITRPTEKFDDVYDSIGVTANDFEVFVNKLIENLKPAYNAQLDAKKQTEQSLFGTDNEEIIKFQLYRTCKNIYDKWVGGTNSIDNLIFRDGLNSRNSIDSKLSTYRAKTLNLPSGGETPRLIDSFRFVTRSFKDIGDKLYVNPKDVVDNIKINPNSSFYDVVTNMLGQNYFDFIALPNYINYNNPDELSNLFKPVSKQEFFKAGATGPSFVCVYAGQPSKNLDFGNSEYPNDGIDFRCNPDGLTTQSAPDFSDESVDHENKVAVFAVNYSQQNQNIFKDITLDQSEFTETAESLRITDEIANKGAENRATFGGQNMYNVYSVRSYKTEVEMMGNAMVQPMMYFQLNNIPMFHGAYMITHVKHAIKPNSMSTVFNGVRIRNVETPLLSVAELYMPLLKSIQLADGSSGGAGTGGGAAVNRTKGYPPIVRTIIENGGTNGNIVSGKITMKPIPKINGVLNQVAGDSTGNQLLSEAADTLQLMLTDWVTWMKSNGFAGNNGNYAYITSAFRTYQEQVRMKAKYGGNAATPGTSNHGWGLAVDLTYFKKDGTPISAYSNGKKPNLSEGYSLETNPSIKWLLDNSYKYGWMIPLALRDGSGLDEFWHWEYHGKSAGCLVLKNTKVRTNYTIPIDEKFQYNAKVKNPMTPDGKEAVYNDCEFTKVGSQTDGENETLKPANPNIAITVPSQHDIDIYTKILQGIGAQPTQENLKFFYAWHQAEGDAIGGPDKKMAAWNPFNTTHKMDNATYFNCNGKNPVKNYATKEDGITATIKTITNGYYPKLLAGLRNNVGAYTLSTYVDELSKWGTGHLINKILAGSKLKPAPIQTTTVQTKTCK